MEPTYLKNEYNRSEARFMLLATTSILILAIISWFMGFPLGTLALIAFFTYLNGVGVLIELLCKPKGVEIGDEGYTFMFRLRPSKIVPLGTIMEIVPEMGDSWPIKIHSGRLVYHPSTDVEQTMRNRRGPGERRAISKIAMSYDLAVRLKEHYQKRRKSTVEVME
jgi:hypothetical protein